MQAIGEGAPTIQGGGYKTHFPGWPNSTDKQIRTIKERIEHPLWNNWKRFLKIAKRGFSPNWESHATSSSMSLCDTLSDWFTLTWTNLSNGLRPVSKLRVFIELAGKVLNRFYFSPKHLLQQRPCIIMCHRIRRSLWTVHWTVFSVWL